MFFRDQEFLSVGHYCSLTVADTTPIDKVYSVTLCNTPTWTECEMESSLVSAEELEDLLDELGCSDDVDEALQLKRGQTLSVGFPQGSYHGAIITNVY